METIMETETKVKTKVKAKTKIESKMEMEKTRSKAKKIIHNVTSADERRRRRRLKRRIQKTVFQFGPCALLLFTCWVIIQVQKRQLVYDDHLDLDAVVHASDIKDVLGEEEIERGNNSTSISSSSSSVLDTIQRYPFNCLADIESNSKPSSTSKSKSTALFWQIPRTGGTTLKHILGSCLNLVQASRMSADYCDVREIDPVLHVCDAPNGLGRFVNADPSDDHGIQRAMELKLVPSGLVDVVVSSRFLHAAALFDDNDGGGDGDDEFDHPNHRGKVFTVMRDPVERIMSTFYYLQNADWERNYNAKYKNMTLMEYVQSDDASTNWMVRWLVGKPSEKIITNQDLDLAKMILQKKVLILLTEEMNTSIDRLIRFMGWDVNLDEDQKKCIDENTSKMGRHNTNSHPKLDVASEEYSLILEKNQYDALLFDFALGLFSEQWKWIP